METLPSIRGALFLFLLPVVTTRTEGTR